MAEWGWEEYGDLDEADSGKDQALDPEMQAILRDLRQLFPFWLITYSPQLAAWVAKSQFGTICENSATLVQIALTRIEQPRVEQAAIRETLFNRSMRAVCSPEASQPPSGLLAHGPRQCGPCAFYVSLGSDAFCAGEMRR